MTGGEAIGGSFRDPWGTVFRRDGVVYRQVNPPAAEHLDMLADSGLYRTLTGEGLLVRHEVVDAPALTDGAHAVLRPEQIPFISYPYEWCFSQLRDAALATLDIQLRCLDHGMSLRDANAYNIQFLRGKPVLIDSLSFEAAEDGVPWKAYGQFCEHFLAPLAVMRYGRPTFGTALAQYLDGVPLELASSLLPSRTKLRPGTAIHLHAHARAQAKAASAPARAQGRRVNPRAVRGIVESLRRAVVSLAPPKLTGEWSGYYGELSYSDEAFASKADIVRAAVRETAPGTVWDLGANTGYFSRIAAAEGADVISMDMDHDSVEASYREMVEHGEEHVLPLVNHLGRPSPSVGWANQERMSLRDRGPADMLLALALIHHVTIAGNVPMERVASYLAGLGRTLVIEFVPIDDPMVQRLLATRGEPPHPYTPEVFERAFERSFTINERLPVAGSGRTIYRMTARD